MDTYVLYEIISKDKNIINFKIRGIYLNILDADIMKNKLNELLKKNNLYIDTVTDFIKNIILNKTYLSILLIVS